MTLNIFTYEQFLHQVVKKKRNLSILYEYKGSVLKTALFNFKFEKNIQRIIKRNGSIHSFQIPYKVKSNSPTPHTLKACSTTSII